MRVRPDGVDAEHEDIHHVADELLKMAGAAGFEPTHGRIKTCCLTAWRRPCICCEECLALCVTLLTARSLRSAVRVGENISTFSRPVNPLNEKNHVKTAA